MSIFIHNCIEYQQNKHNNQKIQTATIQTFSEKASYFNYRISMDTKGPINPPSKQNSFILVITQVHMYAYAHNSQPLSEKNLSPYEIVFHTIPRIPINFELNLQSQRDTYTYISCTSQYCQDLPLHTHYDKFKPFFL